MFEQRLRTLREAAGYSREKLAEVLGMGVASIARYERGENDPSSDVLMRFARFFGVTVDFLLGSSDDPTVNSTVLTEREALAISAWRRGERMEAVKVIVNDE